MFQRSVYQAALVVLAVLTAAGALWLILDPSSPSGVEVSIPPSQALAPTLASDTARAVATPTSSLVNLNTATVKELETLPKIGPVLAQRIVDYRESHGPFQRADQVTAVDGVGLAIYEAIRYLVTVEE